MLILYLALSHYKDPISILDACLLPPTVFYEE